ncbi:MAG: 3-hydroxyacyl-CoA dehydrogenase family protein, partial [Novibacillus thermophilus]
MRHIRQAAVLGSGVMGAAIAGHLANVGIHCTLLDMVPPALTDEEEKRGKTLQDRDVRNRLARLGVERLLRETPSPLYVKRAVDRITVGNLEDDLERLSEVDWIVEAVVEKLSVKQQLLEKVEAVWRPGTIVSSNTSGLSVHEMTAERSPEFRRHFMGTHFFNPPRYMKLLEVIPTEDTDPELVRKMRAFAERVLGKGVVIAKDTPNFIANRIGVYGLLVSFREMVRQEMFPDAVDDITGPAMGRPKSATFRTLDLVGLDTFVHVADNVRDRVSDPWEKDAFT